MSKAKCLAILVALDWDYEWELSTTHVPPIINGLKVSVGEKYYGLLHFMCGLKDKMGYKFIKYHFKTYKW